MQPSRSGAAVRRLGVSLALVAALVSAPSLAGSRDGKSPVVAVKPRDGGAVRPPPDDARNARSAQNQPAQGQDQPADPSRPGVPAPLPDATKLAPEHVAKARQLIYAIGVPDAFEVASSDAMAQIAQAVAQNHPDMVNDMNSVLDHLRPEVAKQTEDMVDVTARFYASVFTEQDIDTILAFFNSAAGKKWNSAQRDIYKQLTSGIQAWQQKVFVTMVARVREEMKKKGHEL